MAVAEDAEKGQRKSRDRADQNSRILAANKHSVAELQHAKDTRQKSDVAKHSIDS